MFFEEQEGQEGRLGSGTTDWHGSLSDMKTMPNNFTKAKLI